MKLTDITNERALDTWADILEPVAEIIADDTVKEKFRNDSKLKLVQYVIKTHKKAVIEILARLDGCDPKNYTFNFVTVPVKLLEILNDPAIADLFTSQGQKAE